MTKIDIKQLTGQSESHLLPIGEQAQQLHGDIIAEFQLLQQRAAEQGMDLQVASGFRSFERQLAIWNGKASGMRPVLDNDGEPLDIAAMPPLQQVHAIMRWSALPGASRHHWGTDFDVWDRAAVAPGYQLQLVTQEYAEGGPFAALNSWLGEQQEVFYRPYDVDRGGIAAEPWHLSHRSRAQQFAAALTPLRLAAVLEQVDMALKQTVLDNLESLFKRYIRVDHCG